MPHTRSRTNQRAKVLFFLQFTKYFLQKIIFSLILCVSWLKNCFFTLFFCVYNKVLVILQVKFDLVCTFDKITNK